MEDIKRERNGVLGKQSRLFFRETIKKRNGACLWNAIFLNSPVDLWFAWVH